MKVRYWILLSAVVALFLAGPASAQLIENLVMGDTDSDSWTIETNIQEGVEIYTDRDATLTYLPEAYQGLDWIKTSNDSADWRGGNPIATFDVTADATVFVATDDRVDPPPCLVDWTDTGDFIQNSEDGDLEYSILSRDFTAGSTVEMCQYEEDAGFYTIMVASAGPPPPPPITITGPGHRLLVDAALDLAVDPGDIEPTAYQWSKDGAELGGETGATFSIGSVVEGDTGDYSCLVTYEEEGGDAAYAEVEPHYYVWVTVAGLPLAGGLGLGLLVGACALAGAVSIRRKR
jgi:hypothetical protein